MVKPNTKYLKKNALHISQTANAKERLKRVDDMKGSLKMLKNIIDKEHAIASEEIIHDFSKTYHIKNIGTVLDLIQRASQFKGEQADIFMKMASGEHVKLAKPNENNGFNAPQNNKGFNG